MRFDTARSEIAGIHFLKGGEKMNRKGAAMGDMTMFFMFMFLLVVIGAGVVVGVLMFFGQGYDFRGVDAELLSYKIKECVLKDSDFFSKGGGDFFTRCKLNEKIVRENNIVKICKGEGDCMDKDGVISVGSNFPSCRFEGSGDNLEYPRCDEEKFVTQSGERVWIIVGSKQVSRRVANE